VTGSGLQPDGAFVPEFAGQRPAFVEGNGAAVTHGAYSSVLRLAPRAAEIAAELVAISPVRADADGPVLELLALTLVRVERAAAALDALDRVTEENPTAAYVDRGRIRFEELRKDMRAWISTSARLLGDLGMQPSARARLGLDIARTAAVGSGLMAGDDLLDLSKLHPSVRARIARLVVDGDEQE
jgi:hypothetical protein